MQTQEMTSKPQGCLKVLKATGLKFESKIHRKPRFLVTVTPSWKNGGTLRPSESDVVESREPVWDHLVGLHYPDNAHGEQLALVLNVIEHGPKWLTWPKTIVGTVTLSLQQLRDSTEEVALKLQPSGTIIVCFQPMDVVVQELEHAAQKISPSEELHPVLYNLEAIVESLETLMEGIDSLSMIHPYVHIAWTTVSSVATIIKAKINTDAAIQGLTERLRSLYTFADTLNFHAVEPVLESVIAKVLSQTIECAIFVQEYAGDGCLSKIGSILGGTVTKKIEEFSAAISTLAHDLDMGVATQTALVSLRIESEVGELVLRERLQPVEYSWVDRPRCQMDTRLVLMSDIVKWALNMSQDREEQASNVWFLRGLARSGKSTIAVSLADFFALHKRLGAFLLFSRNQESNKQPSTTIQSLAFALSQFDAGIHKHIKAVTTEFTHIINLPLVTQFEKLIQEPLNAAFNEKSPLSQQGPIVIIIDALDECGVDGEAGREELFNVLVRGSARLPPHIRIIITGRNTNDMKKHFEESKEAHHIHCVMLETDKQQIELYLKHKLQDIWERHRWSLFPTPQQIDTLVERAACLFIWAATACRHVDAYKGNKRFKSLCDGKFTGDAEESLDLLYVHALRAGNDWQLAEYRTEARAVLGLIAIAKTPISLQAINKFVGSDVEYQEIIAGLASVLDKSESTGTVRILHASFRDFLSDQKRCKDICPPKGCSPQCQGRCKDGPWFISAKDNRAYNEEVARKCLSILSDGFGVGLGDTFNPVGLGETFMPVGRGDNFSNLAISRDDAMIYASTYWTSHICDMSVCPEGFDQVLEDFLKTHILHWLQAMSILGTSLGCAGKLQELLLWATKNASHKKYLLELLYDSARFAGFFATSIAEHPAMVYQCALPFAPTDSHIYRIFHSPSLPTIMGGYLRSWSQSPSRTLPSRTKTIFSLSFRNTQVLSTGGASFDSSDGIVLRQWDTRTGVESMTSQNLDDQAVAVFSRDGHTIWCATMKGTITEFDALTGRSISCHTAGQAWRRNEDPPEKSSLSGSLLSRSTGPGDLIRAATSQVAGSHHEKVELTPATLQFARAAFSHNRDIVVFQADEGHLYVVDTASGVPKHYSPLKGLPLHFREPSRLFPSLVFSLADCSFAVATEDGLIQVWSTDTGSVLKTLDGHTAEVTALRYTSETTLISCSVDGTVRKWSWEGEPAVQVTIICLEPAPTNSFEPLLLNASGSLMASTLMDGTITIWSVDAGKELARFEGHINSISAAAFAEDDAKFVSASFLERIHLWDIDSRGSAEAVERLRRHVRPVKEITIMDDGTRIRSWREDSTKYWDMMTGKELELKVSKLGEEQLVLADTGEEWKQESSEDSVAAQEFSKNHGIALQVRTTTVQPPDLFNPFKFLNFNYNPFQVKLDVLGPHQQLLWRLPREFYLRQEDAQAVHSSFLALGLWSGRVISVFLPLQHLLMNAKGQPLTSNPEVAETEQGDAMPQYTSSYMLLPAVSSYAPPPPPPSPPSPPPWEQGVTAANTVHTGVEDSAAM
ncbi:hypothetical protein C8R46DRAFT_391977 [Mycena filopes]|nr:hypothetical protein C8R46DRAFT_391977 [Mycena filopes]